MAIPIYSRTLFSASALGIGTIAFPADPVNTQIIRDLNFYSVLGGQFILKDHLGTVVCWNLIVPPNSWDFNDSKHWVQPAGQDWLLDLTPVGVCDVYASGYFLSPP